MCKLCYEWNEKMLLGEVLGVKRKYVDCSCLCADDQLTKVDNRKGKDTYTLCRKCGHGFYGGGTERKHIDR